MDVARNDDNSLFGSAVYFDTYGMTWKFGVRAKF
jgi:hypothetical protein